MREIKFKVWDKNKEVFIPEDVYAIINRTSFNAFGVMITDWQDYKEGEYFYDNAQELVLFTGLKDRNGVEIFEGDILESNDAGFSAPDQYCAVKYSGSSFVVYNPNCCYACKNSFGCICNLDECGNIFEVIGNIYQNPELLTTPNRG